MHNRAGGGLSGVVWTMTIVALSECEPRSTILQSEASFPMVKFYSMTGYAKILHRRLRLLNSVMSDRIPPIPRLFQKRLALRKLLDRYYIRSQICWPCRSIRLLLILGIGLVIGLWLTGCSVHIPNQFTS